MIAALRTRHAGTRTQAPRFKLSGLRPVALGLARLGVRAAWRRPDRVLAGALIAAAGGVISYNALTLQAARHPAPIFGQPRSEAVESSSRRSDARPSSPLPPARPVTVPSAPTSAPAAAKQVARDPIGELIRGEATGSTAQPGKGEPQRVVALAQRALGKLGYGPLKADGLMGAGTKQAIERFERDRRLPETGELGPRTARELAARSGMTIE
jgi:hypothetical protein